MVERSKREHAEDVTTETENARLRKALTFYADVSKYPAPLTGGMGALWYDCGQVARSALSSAAAAEREPVAWRYKLFESDPKWTVATEKPKGVVVEPLFTTPPTSELEAENARLREQVVKATNPEYLAEKIEQVGMVDIEWKRRANAAEARLAEALMDTARIDGLREMCGYVEDGSSDILKICQDDATSDWLVRTGDAWPAHGRTLRQAIDAAIAARRVREGGKADD